MKLIHSILMSFCCLTFVTSCSEKQQKQTQLPSVKVDTVVANGEKKFSPVSRTRESSTRY